MTDAKNQIDGRNYIRLAVDYYEDAAVITAGVEAEVLLVRMTCWSRDRLTDGRVPTAMVPRIGAGLTDPAGALAALAEAGPVVIDEEAREAVVTAFCKWQDTKELVDSKRAYWRKKKAEAKNKGAEKPQVSPGPGDVPAGNSGDSNEIPPEERERESKETPTESQSGPSGPGGDEADAPRLDMAGYRTDVDDLCDFLANSIASGSGVDRPTVAKKWRTEMRRLIDQDKRDPQKVRIMIQFGTTDDHWQTYIQSAKSLRNNWSALQSAAKKQRWTPDGGSQNKQGRAGGLVTGNDETWGDS